MRAPAVALAALTLLAIPLAAQRSEAENLAAAIARDATATRLAQAAEAALEHLLAGGAAQGVQALAEAVPSALRPKVEAATREWEQLSAGERERAGGRLAVISAAERALERVRNRAKVRATIETALVDPQRAGPREAAAWEFERARRLLLRAEAAALGLGAWPEAQACASAAAQARDHGWEALAALLEAAAAAEFAWGGRLEDAERLLGPSAAFTPEELAVPRARVLLRGRLEVLSARSRLIPKLIRAIELEELAKQLRRAGMTSTEGEAALLAAWVRLENGEKKAAAKVVRRLHRRILKLEGADEFRAQAPLCLELLRRCGLLREGKRFVEAALVRAKRLKLLPADQIPLHLEAARMASAREDPERAIGLYRTVIALGKHFKRPELARLATANALVVSGRAGLRVGLEELVERLESTPAAAPQTEVVFAAQDLHAGEALTGVGFGTRAHRLIARARGEVEGLGLGLAHLPGARDLEPVEEGAGLDLLAGSLVQRALREKIDLPTCYLTAESMAIRDTLRDLGPINLPPDLARRLAASDRGMRLLSRGLAVSGPGLPPSVVREVVEERKRCFGALRRHSPLAALRAVPRARELGRLRKQLRRDKAALLYPRIAPRGVSRALAISSDFWTIKAILRDEGVAGMLAATRKALRSGASASAWATATQPLAEALFGRTEAGLEGAKTVLVIDDPELRGIPLGALATEPMDRWDRTKTVGARFRVVRIPAASALPSFGPSADWLRTREVTVVSEKADALVARITDALGSRAAGIRIRGVAPEELPASAQADGGILWLGPDLAPSWFARHEGLRPEVLVADRAHAGWRRAMLEQGARALFERRATAGSTFDALAAEVCGRMLGLGRSPLLALGEVRALWAASDDAARNALAAREGLELVALTP